MNPFRFLCLLLPLSGISSLPLLPVSQSLLCANDTKPNPNGASRWPMEQSFPGQSFRCGWIWEPGHHPAPLISRAAFVLASCSLTLELTVKLHVLQRLPA